MPQKSGFFDTTADDPREYPAREFAEYFGRLLTNGVFNAGTFLNVTASGTDANVSLSPGAAWIKGYAYSVYDSPLILPIQPATTQDRIDRVILRLDTSTAVRAIRALVVQGVAAANPSPPALIRSGDIYDLSLAQIRVRANSTIVQQANITDERLNSAVCGLVNSLIAVDTTTFQQQWDTFIASIQGSGFATPAYVDSKAAAAETNAKNASLPRTGGTVSGPLTLSSTLRVNGEVTFADGGTYSSLKQSVVDGKNSVEAAIIGKDGTVSKAGSVATFPELVNGVNSIEQGIYSVQILERPTTTRGIEYNTPLYTKIADLATIPAKTKLISIQTTTFHSDFSTSMQMITGSAWIQGSVCLVDSSGVRWLILGCSNYRTHINSMTIDIQAGLARTHYSDLQANANVTIYYPRIYVGSAKPANFNNNGTMYLQFILEWKSGDFTSGMGPFTMSGQMRSGHLVTM